MTRVAIVPWAEIDAEYHRKWDGNRALPQLTKYIAKTMPEDKPGTCVGLDAANVAAYIYDAFYPPRLRRRSRLQARRPRPAHRRRVSQRPRGLSPAALGRGQAVREGGSWPGSELYSNQPEKETHPHASRSSVIDPVINIDFAAEGDDTTKKLKTSRGAGRQPGGVLLLALEYGSP